MNERLICDLCGDHREIRWTHTTHNEAASAGEAKRTGKFWAEDPEWAVCQFCHELIEAGDLNVLIYFCLTRQKASVPGSSFLREIAMLIIEDKVPEVLTLFWKHRVPELTYAEPGHRIPTENR